MIAEIWSIFFLYLNQVSTKNTQNFLYWPNLRTKNWSLV